MKLWPYRVTNVYLMSAATAASRPAPQSAVHQLLPLLFGNNGKEARHHAAAVPAHRVEEAARSASTVISVLHLKNTAGRMMTSRQDKTAL